MTDIRIINTKNRIRMGMINALKEKPLNEVTTKDIIEAAEVSRKTFYTYYNDQNDLLFEIENAMISDLVEGMKKDREAVTQLDDTADQVEIAKLADQAFVETVKACAKHREVTRILLSANGDINFLSKIKKAVYKELLARAPKLVAANDPSVQNLKKQLPVRIPLDYLFEIYVGLMVNIIQHWLTSEDPISQRQVRGIMEAAQILSPLQLLAFADLPEDLNDIEDYQF